MRRMRTWFLFFFGAIPLLAAGAPSTGHSVRIHEIASVEGVRENPLLGYGIVVGLNGTGDRSQTIFTTQTLSGILQRLGVQTVPTTMMVKNVAAVMVTANLPAFAIHGTQIDATVSSMGDAKSLEGGTLLLTPLYGADGRVYAAAQGSLTVGGYSASSAGNSKQVNHPTVGRLSGGAVVERDFAVSFADKSSISLLLREPDFGTAHDVVETVNAAFGSAIAAARDSRQVEITMPPHMTVPELLAKVEGLEIPVHSSARVVVNERTGTIVLGGEVQLGAVSIFHGNLSIEIAKENGVSQPASLSNGNTVATTSTSVRAQDSPARVIELREGASVSQLVEGLQKIGASARDVVAILQAMKAAGAMRAELEVL